MDKVKRPALRYHGGKWRLAPWIIGQFPDHKKYVEPFGGAASVLLRKPRSIAEVYNDLDDSIVNVFQQMRDHGQELRNKLALTPFARTEFERAHVDSDDPLEQARRIVIRSYMGIGTDAIRRKSNGFRADSTRNCAAEWSGFPAALEQLVDRLRGVIIENRDYKRVIEAHDSSDTLFYVDPPYVHSTRTTAHGYSYEMSNDDHAELAKILHSVKGKVVLSGYDTVLYQTLYYGWRRVERPHRAFFGKETVEVLWMNFSEKDREWVD